MHVTEEQKEAGRADLYKQFKALGLGTAYQIFLDFCIVEAAIAIENKDKKAALLYHRAGGVIDQSITKLVKIQEQLQ